jgi:hypothetical protein
MLQIDWRLQQSQAMLPLIVVEIYQNSVYVFNWFFMKRREYEYKPCAPFNR